MNLLALPAFTDNYIWMLHDGHQALVVDPGDASPVLEALQRLGLELTAILVTHRHLDHVGGVLKLRSVLKGQVYGPANSVIDGIDVRLREGDHVQFQGANFEVWDTPGHTADHISYLAHVDQSQPAQPSILFCGDTLFSAGCGRLYDGTIEQLFTAINRIKQLPGDTLVCCTHEYTLDNLRFARVVEPDNAEMARYEQRCQQLRHDGQATLPTTVRTEQALNPYMRCDQPQVIASAQQHGATDATALSVFTAVRQWKNTFQT